MKVRKDVGDQSQEVHYAILVGERGHRGKRGGRPRPGEFHLCNLLVVMAFVLDFKCSPSPITTADDMD